MSRTRTPMRMMRMMRMKTFSLFAALAVVAVVSMALLAGCGYGLVGRGSSVPADVKSVYLKPLENKTRRSQADQFLTRAIADELVTRQRFAVAASTTGADAEISGSVVGFSANPVSFDNTGRATEYEISITASILFKRVGSDKVLWKNERYNFRESYPVTVSDAAFFDRENLALEQAAKRFAQTMVSDLLEGF